MKTYVLTLRQLAEKVGDSLAAAATVLCIDKTALSRLLRAWRRPDWSFSKDLHQKANGSTVTALSELFEMHAAAEAAEPSTPTGLRDELRRLREENDELRRENEAAAAAQKSHRLPADTGGKAPLPVPPPRGDRQGSRKVPLLAQEMTDSTISLETQGRPEAVLAAMREGAEVMTPVECAAAMMVFRSGEHRDLARTFTVTYGRDHPDQDVIHVAHELLREHELPADAESLLCAARNRRAGSP